MRCVDDSVVGFETREEAEPFHEALRQRFATCGLERHPENTRGIEFGRFAQERRRKLSLGQPESFTFLGFTPISGQSRKGRVQMQRRTIAQRFRAKLAEINVELRRRRHLPVPGQGAWLRPVLLGHDQYDGVPRNGKA